MEQGLSERPWHDLIDAVKSYWRTYGGLSAFMKSPFTHIAVLIEVFCIPIWVERSWPDFVLLFLPPILGFTLAGYALVFAFGDDFFRKIMAGSHRQPGQPVFYTQISATYLHFIIVQVVAIAFAVIAKADPGRPIFHWLVSHNSSLAVYHDTARNLGYALAGFAFLPAALALTNSLAAAFAINSVIRLYVDLYSKPQAPKIDSPKPELGVRGLS